MPIIKKIILKMKSNIFLKWITGILIFILIYNVSIYYDKKISSSEKNDINQSVTSKTNLNSNLNTNENLGAKFFNEGNVTEALKYYQIALEEEIVKYGENNVNVAEIQHAIGNIYLEINQLDIAQEWFEKALNITISSSGDEKYSATIYTDLGHTFREKKDYVKALKYFNIALEIEKKFGKNKTRDCAIGYSNIASVYSSLNDYNKALEYYNQELLVYQNNPEIGIKDLAICYHDIGLTFSELNDYTSALKYYQLALPIYQQYWSPSHPRWATINNNLSCLYYDIGDYKKSLEYLQIPVSIYEKNAYSFNYELADCYNSLSYTYKKMSQIDEAIKYGKKAFQTIDKNNPYNFEAINTLKNNLIVLYESTGNDLNELNKWFLSQ